MVETQPLELALQPRRRVERVHVHDRAIFTRISLAVGDDAARVVEDGDLHGVGAALALQLIDCDGRRVFLAQRRRQERARVHVRRESAAVAAIAITGRQLNAHGRALALLEHVPAGAVADHLPLAEVPVANNTKQTQDALERANRETGRERVHVHPHDRDTQWYSPEPLQRGAAVGRELPVGHKRRRVHVCWRRHPPVKPRVFCVKKVKRVKRVKRVGCLRKPFERELLAERGHLRILARDPSTTKSEGFSLLC